MPIHSDTGHFDDRSYNEIIGHNQSSETSIRSMRMNFFTWGFFKHRRTNAVSKTILDLNHESRRGAYIRWDEAMTYDYL